MSIIAYTKAKIDTLLGAKADLSGGVVPDTQLPGRLSDTSLRAAFVPFWEAAETVTAGTIRVAPDGTTIERIADGTTGASYDTTEQAAWTPKGGGGGGGTVSDGGTWATATAYTVGEVVSQAGVRYECAAAHTSGTFSTDKTAGKWVALGVDSGAAVTLPTDAAGWLHDDGNGTLSWSTPTPSDTGAVAKAGGTMTGPLTLSGPPTASLHAATRAYVDAAAGRPVGFPLFMAPSASSGRMTSIGGYGGNATSGVATNGNGQCAPFYVERAATFTLGLKCATAGGTGALARLGVWNDGNGYPGTLLADLGTVTATTVDSGNNPPSQWTTTSVALSAGVRYWVGFILQGAPATLPQFAAVNQPSWAVLANVNGEGHTLQITGVTGALADNPCGTTVSSMIPRGQATLMARVFFKES